MEDAEFGLMLAAALDAIHAGELDGHEWRSRLLDNCNIIALDNTGCEWTFIWHFPKSCEQRLRDEMDAAPEKSAASKESAASDAFVESMQCDDEVVGGECWGV